MKKLWPGKHRQFWTLHKYMIVVNKFLAGEFILLPIQAASDIWCLEVFLCEGLCNTFGCYLVVMWQ